MACDEGAMRDPKILAGIAVLAMAAGWFYVKPNYIDAKPAPVYTSEELEHAPNPVLLLDERVLNLAGGGAAGGRYVKVGVALEFSDPDHVLVGKTAEDMAIENEELQVEMERYMPRMLDSLHRLLGSPEFDGITAATAEPFKRAFLAEVNEIVDGREAEAVYLTTFVTQ